MKYNAFLISQCNWASEGVGYSDAMEPRPAGYPFEPKPGSVIYDYVDLRKPMGRHPDTGLPLWIDEPNTARRIQEVDEEGINSMGSEVTPPLNHPIDASLANCKISADAIITDIDEDSRFLVWGLESLLEVPVYPAGKEDWQMDLPVTSDRKTEFDTFMTARGTAAQTLSDYWTENPDVTYRQVAADFGLFL